MATEARQLREILSITKLAPGAVKEDLLVESLGHVIGVWSSNHQR